MYHREKRSAICFLLILSMLFFGMCFDYAQADSFLACQEESASQAGHSYAHPVPGLRFAASSVPSEKAYVPKTFQTGRTILAPRPSVRRAGARMCRCAGFALIAVDVLPRLFPPASGSDSHSIFREIISNTIIMTYIHSQDGQKSS